MSLYWKEICPAKVGRTRKNPGAGLRGAGSCINPCMMSGAKKGGSKKCITMLKCFNYMVGE